MPAKKRAAVAKKKSAKKSQSGKKPQPKPQPKPNKTVKRETKEALFAEAYLAHKGNATKAAQAIGVPEVSASEIGRRLLTKVEIQERVRELVAERTSALAVKSKEVIGTLAEHMRVDIALVFEPDGSLDLQACRARGVSTWIKKVKVTQRLIPKEDGGETEIERKTEVEVHDSQAAAGKLARILGLEQAPRRNERERIEQAVTEYMERKKTVGEPVTRKQAVLALVDASPKFAQLLSDVGE